MERFSANKICYVCGFDFNTDPLGERQNWPFIFCPCCCFEYGIEDLNMDCFMNSRNKWINDGLLFGYKLYPNDYAWSIDVVINQLQNLRKVDLSNYPNGVKMNPGYEKEVDIAWVRYNWERVRKR